MARIRINFSAVQRANHELQDVIREMGCLEDILARLRREMDPAVQSRDQIGQTLRRAAAEMAAMEKKAKRLHAVVEQGADSYRVTEKRLSGQAPDNRSV